MNKVSTRANILTRRTYNRPLNEEGTIFETWEETVDRVIGHQQWLWERALTHKILIGMPLKDITDDMDEWVSLNQEQMVELSELRVLMLDRKALPSGRTIWLGGTEISRTRESSMFNCSFSTLENIYDIVDLFWLLLQGCGVGVKPIVGNLTGFRSRISEIEIIRSKRTKHERGKEENEESFYDGIWTISIGDSAEAWARSIGKLLVGKFKAKKLILDFSEIRGPGKRLKGYGWLSSGDEAIAKAYPAIAGILNKRAGSLLRKVDIIEIMNHLGTVLSSRRSAIITFVDYDSDEWQEFTKLKRNCYEEGHKHKQQSNNSLMFNIKPDIFQMSELFDMMIENGGSEPGFFNMETAKKRAPYTAGANPCAEILLPSKGFCNLVEVDISKFKGDAAGLHQAYHIIARANYRQTCVDLNDGILSESWNTNNKFLRLCGVGATGISGRDDLTQYDITKLRDSAVFAARNMAKELGTEFPKAVTTVKPSGCREGNGLITTTQGIFTLEELMHKENIDWGNEINLDVIQDIDNNKATKTYKNGFNETMIINLSYGMELISTPNHKWFVSRRNDLSGRKSKTWKPIWIRTDELIPERDFIDIKLNTFNNSKTIYLDNIEQTYNTNSIEIKQPNILTEDLSWFFGYLWGDGSLSESKYRVRFIDEHIFNLEKIVKIFKEYFDIDAKIHKASEGRNASVVEIGSVNLYNWIIQNGFYKYKQDKTLNNIPLNIRKSSNLIIAFIAGLIDSDGCVSSTTGKHKFIISTAQDVFSKHLQDVCWSVGIGIGRSLNTKGKNHQKEKHMWLMSNTAYYTDKNSFKVLLNNSNKVCMASSNIPWNWEVCKRLSIQSGRVKSVINNENIIETFDIEVANDHWYYAGSVKSHNTLGKIMDSAGEGIHKPEAKYLFNWVNFSNHDPLVLKLKEANYRWLVNPSDSTGTLICLPVSFDDVEFTKKEVFRKDGTSEILEVNDESAITQLERYKKWQVHYCDQNVSNTIYYRPEEKDKIIDWLLDNWDIYVGVSFLFKNDPTVSARDLGYDYLPQEYVSEDTFFKYFNTLTEINWDDTDSDLEVDSGSECSSGMCPVI